MDRIIPTIEIENGVLTSLTYSEALAKGVAAAAAGKALKAVELAEVAKTAEIYRARLIPASPGKLASYRIKEAIARNPEAASAKQVEHLTAEAATKGLSFEDLCALIIARADAYADIAMLVERLEAETKASIAAIADDDPEIETKFQRLNIAATAQAKAAFGEAQEMLGAS